MDLKISIAKPDWDPNPDKSTTDNHEWRKCVIVEFPNCSFKWIPTYRHLAQVTEALDSCEDLNKTLAKKYFFNKNETIK